MNILKELAPELFRAQQIEEQRAERTKEMDEYFRENPDLYTQKGCVYCGNINKKHFCSHYN